MYNVSIKILITPIHLIGGFTYYDKRHQKLPSYLRGKGNNPLWRIIPNSQILSKTQNKTSFPDILSNHKKRRSIFCFRVTCNYPLLYNCWNITHRKYPPLTIQWSIQKTSWSGFFPEPNNYKALSSSAFTQRYPPNCKSTQFASEKDISSSIHTNQCSVRYRPNSDYRFWQTTKNQSRLQSQETWQKVLFSLPLFRIQSSGILAWQPASRERASNKISQTLSDRLYSQTAEISKKDSHSGRFEFSGSQIYQFLRRKQHKIYHRSATDSTHKRDCPDLEISTLQKGLGSFRIHIPFKNMENSPQICCSTSSPSRRSGRNISIESHINKRIWVPGYYNQSQFETETYLELPQSESEGRRAKYQRTKKQLSTNKDSHSKLYSKYCLSSTPFIRFQYNKLVQATMSPKRIQIQDITGYSPGFNHNTGKIGQNRGQKYSEVSSRVSLQRTVLSNNGNN